MLQPNRNQRRRQPNGRRLRSSRQNDRTALTRTPLDSGDTIHTFNRRCWELTVTNSAGSFVVALPPDAGAGASSFLNFGTPATDYGAADYVPFAFLLSDDNIIGFSDVLSFFREFQIQSAAITFSSLTSDTWSATTGCPLLEVITAIDPTAVGPAPGPSYVLEYANSRRSLISQERSLTVRFAPRFQMNVEGSAIVTPSAYNANSRDIWAMSNAVDFPQWTGLIGCIRNFANSPGVGPVLRVSCVLTFAARRIR